LLASEFPTILNVPGSISEPLSPTFSSSSVYPCPNSPLVMTQSLNDLPFLPVPSHLNLITSAKTLFLYNVNLTGNRAEDFNLFLGGERTQFNP
jgi:hypothetical protein